MKHTCIKTAWFPSVYGWTMFLCLCRSTTFFYLFISMYILTTINSATVNAEVWVYLQYSDFISFSYIPNSGVAGSNGSSIFNFLINLHTIFQNCWTNLHPHPEGIWFLFSPYSLQCSLYLVFFFFLIIVTLTGMKLYHIMVSGIHPGVWSQVGLRKH